MLVSSPALHSNMTYDLPKYSSTTTEQCTSAKPCTESLEITTYPSKELLASPHLHEIIDFINVCFYTMHRDYHTFEAPRFVDLDEFWEEFDQDGIFFSVARDPVSREIIAAGGYRPVDADTVELKCLCTAERYEGKGIGTWMNRTVEDLARKDGFKKINAVVLREHGTLVEFYERLGYAKQREQLCRAGSGDMGFENVIDITLWHMQKAL